MARFEMKVKRSPSRAEATSRGGRGINLATDWHVHQRKGKWRNVCRPIPAQANVFESKTINECENKGRPDENVERTSS